MCRFLHRSLIRLPVPPAQDADPGAPAPPPPSSAGPDYSSVQRNLALELVRVTEAAALAGGRWFGKGDKNAADQVRPPASALSSIA